MSSTYIPKRAMWIYAHPDDIEFSGAGTAAFWAQHGTEICYVLITDGNVGTDDMEMTQAELGELRREEQREACRITGVQQVVFLGYPDGRLVPTLTLRRDLTREIRKFRPNVVVCGDPSVYFSGTRINHPDHRAAATAAIDAIYPSADSPLLFPELAAEGLASHKINYVYVTNWEQANTYIDISSTIDTKIAALKAHDSQLGGWAELEQRIREWAANTGQKVGFEYAEAFRKITLREDKEEDEQ